MRWRAQKPPVTFLSFVKLEAKGGGAAIAAARGGPRHERSWAGGLDYGQTLFMHRILQNGVLALLSSLVCKIASEFSIATERSGKVNIQC